MWHLGEPGENVDLVMRRPVLLGVEGGGSKARAIMEQHGRVSARLERNGLNPSDITCEEFEARLRSLLTPLLAPLRGSRAPVYAYFALAGAGKPAVRRKCRAAIVRSLRGYGACRRIKVTTDAGALVERYLQNRDGLVLIAGTGSISMAVRHVGGHRRLVRVGGRGGSLDRGSGHWIGAQLIGAALSTPGRAGGAGERSRTAALAPVVLCGYGQGDEFARRVVAEAASDLVGMVVAAAEKSGLRGSARLYLAGGLFQHRAFEKLFRRRLRQALPGIAPQVSADDLTGLLELAKRLAGARRRRPVRSAACRP